MVYGIRTHLKDGKLIFPEASIYSLYQQAGEYAIPQFDAAVESIVERMEGVSKMDYISAFQDSEELTTTVIRVEKTERKAPVWCGTEKNQNTLVFNGQLTGNCVESFTPFDDFLIHVCNLVSINVYEATPEGVGKYAELSVKMLNAVIELTNDNLLPGARSHNLMYRSIGIGMMGIADVLAEREMSWRDEATPRFVEKITEDIAYHALKQSVSMSAIYPVRSFKDPGSSWHEGKMYGKDIK